MQLVVDHMRSTVLPATTSSGEQDEEGSPLVPPSMEEEEITDKDGAPCKKDDGTAPVRWVARTGRWLSSLGTVLRTRGVASVMVSFVLLALLLGGRSWIGLDSSVSIL